MTRARFPMSSAGGTSDASLTSIAVCTVGELFGGVERHVLELASSLKARGIRTLFCLFHDGELASQARQHGIEVIILPDANRLLFSSSRQLAGILEHRNVCIVHAHGYKAMVFCAIARRMHRFALVKTEHGLPEKPPGGRADALRSRVYHALDAVATRFSGATVCCVTEELRALRADGSTRRARVIPNGIRGMDRRELPYPPEFSSGRFNVAAVGRLDAVKALQLAIDAVSALSQDVHLYLVGTGPCENELRNRAEMPGVAGRVHFLGFRRDAHSFIAHCDVLVMPSLHEGLPYTLLEAMALGTAVVASRVGGLAETIQDRVTGLLISPGDARALADAISLLKTEPALRARLGQGAQDLQRAKYSLEAMTDSYLEIYREALAGKA